MATSNIALHCKVATLQEAETYALTRWRVISQDPEATLPWSTHFELSEPFDDTGTHPLDVTITITSDQRKSAST